MTNKLRITSILLSFVLLFNIVFSVGANVYADELTTGKCGDNVTYSFNSETGTLTISGTGDMYDYQVLDGPEWPYISDSPFDHSSLIKNMCVEDGVTSIGDYSFHYCKSLETITMPNTIEKIGDDAFLCCEALRRITLPNSLIRIGTGAFSNCSKIGAVIIPDSVTYIGVSAFAYCSHIGNATIGKGLSVISNSMFSSCSELRNITIPNQVMGIGKNAFNNCINLKTVFYIGTKEQWKNINIDSNNSYISNANIYYEIHTYDDGMITTQPTCTKSGVKTYTCTDCGDKKTESIDPLGHKYIETITLLSTCTGNGIAEYTCSNCGDTYTKDIAKLGHNYVKTVTKATPKKNGKIVTKCSRCGDSSTKTVYAPKYVELNANTFEYDGKVKTPKVVVYNSNDEIVNKSNYTVTYSKGRKKLGTYTVTVKFKGNYSGTVKKTFRIAPKRVKVSSIKVKAASTEEISVSWGKVKGVDGYEIYRWNDKEEKYKFYKKTTKTSIKIKRDSKKYNDVYFAIRTYKKVGKKTHKSVFTHEYGWVKLSAPSFKVEQEDFNEFTLIFSHEDRYDIQISNNKDFANSDSDRTKNRWTKSYREYCKKLCFGNAKSNKKYYVRARKYYYNKKGKLVVGPWSKVTVVKPY